MAVTLWDNHPYDPSYSTYLYMIDKQYKVPTPPSNLVGKPNEVAPIFDPETNEYLGAVSMDDWGKTKLHPHDCKCTQCASEWWKEKQREAAARKNVKPDNTDLVNALQRQVTAQGETIDSLNRRINKLNAGSKHGPNGSWALSARIDSIETINTENLRLLRDVQTKLRGGVLVDVSSKIENDAMVQIQKLELGNKYDAMAKRRAMLYFLVSIPPTLLATVGFALGITLLGAPAAVIAFVALVCAWNAAPLKNAIQNRESKLIELRAEQSFAITASVNGWTPPELEKGQD